MIPEEILEKIEQLKQDGAYDQALKLINKQLAKDPSNKEALFQVADIEYRKGEIMRAEKPIDFLLKDADDDAMSYYIKGVLEMEKTHRKDAKFYFKKTLKMMESDNPEVMRCYGLCEYRSGNREEGIMYVTKAFELNSLDAEVILNLLEITILEKKWDEAEEYVHHYHAQREHIQFFDRKKVYYDEKIRIFEEYIHSQQAGDI